MIKNLIFDFGGVIAPISREQAVEAFRQLGVADADQRLDKYHQTGIFQKNWKKEKLRPMSSR